MSCYLRSDMLGRQVSVVASAFLIFLCCVSGVASAAETISLLWHLTLEKEGVTIDHAQSPGETPSAFPDIIVERVRVGDRYEQPYQWGQLIGFDQEGSPQILTDWLPRERLIPPLRPGYPWRVVGDSSAHHGAGRTASRHHGLKQLDPSMEPPAVLLRPLPSGTAYLAEGKDGSASLWSEHGLRPLPVEGKVSYSCLNYGERDSLSPEFVLFETVTTMDDSAGEHQASFWRADGTLAFRDRGRTPGKSPRNPLILDRGRLLLYWFERRQSGKVIYPARLVDTRSHVDVRHDVDLPLGFWAVSKDGSVFAINELRQEPERHALIHTYRVRPGPQIEPIATIRLDAGRTDVGLNDAGTVLALRRKTESGPDELLLYSLTGTPLSTPIAEAGPTHGLCFPQEDLLYSGISRWGGKTYVASSRHVYAYRIEW